jgi:adenosylcobinamide-GDP ribazoletransferase
MKKEVRVFLTAVMFMTRIRVPSGMNINQSAEYLQQAPRYFPVVGWIVGAFSSLLFLVFSRYISTDTGILASMITGILLTGAFHEDGFADVCDGLGGGWTKENILQIMKDSRIGAFGAIGLMAILSSKFLLLKELPGYTPDLSHPSSSVFFTYRYFILGVIAAHSVSRLMPVLVMQAGVYAADPERSKAKPLTNKSLNLTGLVSAIVLALTPFVFLPPVFLLVVLPALYTTYELYRYFRKWIGGYTGDCLGAIQQVTEIVIYLGFILIWRYL